MHSSASPYALVTVTDEAYATPPVVHGMARVAKVIPPLLVTMTRLPSSTAATRACVAIGRGLLTCVTSCHAPPDSGRRVKVPRLPHPPCGRQSAVSASAWPSITSSDRIEPPGLAAAAQCAPPSVVSHSPLPKTNPCDGVPNRMPQTAGPERPPGWASGTTGAGSPRQLAPRSSVRTIDAHGAWAHGAVPRTNASRSETNVTEVAANPAGTGPPAGTDAAGPAPGDALAAGPVAADAGDVALTPPDGEVAGVEERAPAPPPPAPPECADPHPDN